MPYLRLHRVTSDTINLINIPGDCRLTPANPFALSEINPLKTYQPDRYEHFLHLPCYRFRGN